MAKLDEQHVTTQTRIAEEAITKGYAIKPGAAQNGAVLCDSQGEAIAGVAGEDAASGEPFLVISDGMTKAIAADAITLHAQVTPTAAGKFETAASGDVIAGIARSAAGADGDEFIIELIRGKATV